MKRAYHLEDPDLLASLDVYMAELIDLGYSEGTIRDYVSSAGKYLETGRPLTKEAIEEYIQEKLDVIGDNKRKRGRVHTIKTGIMRYFELFDGCDGETLNKLIKQDGPSTRKICDEDCFNCKYPDCIFV